jgi:plasmid stabilization system protein ParE
MPRPTVQITHNFARNLEEIESFLLERDGLSEWNALIEKLFDRIIPNLQRFPDMGVDFLSRQPGSAEGILSRDELRGWLKKSTVIREYISGDYLLLYAVRKDSVILLSIKHHLQLSFDLRGHWDPLV